MIKLADIINDVLEGSEMMWFHNPDSNQMTNPNKDFPYHPAMDHPELKEEEPPGNREPILARREGVDYTYIKMADLLRETIEVIEIIEFYKRADDDQKIEFERLWNAGKEEELQALIDRVTRSNLVGFNRKGDSFSLGRPGWRPSRKGAN